MLTRETHRSAVIDPFDAKSVLIARADVPVVETVVGVAELVHHLVGRPVQNDDADTGAVGWIADASPEVFAVSKPQIAGPKSSPLFV